MPTTGGTVPIRLTRGLSVGADDVAATLAWDPAGVIGTAGTVPEAGDGRLLVPLQMHLAGVTFDRSAAVGFGPVVEEDDGARVLPVWWEAAEQPWLFPSFDGGLEVRPAPGGAELCLEGRYRPPGGPAGGLINRALLQRAATRSLEELLDRLAAVFGAGMASSLT